MCWWLVKRMVWLSIHTQCQSWACIQVLLLADLVLYFPYEYWDRQDWTEQTARTQILWHLIRVYIDCHSSSSFYIGTLTLVKAGLGGSVGCAVRLETRRSRVQPLPRSATFFREDWPWNIFYGHSPPSADSRRAVVSFWRKNVHNTG